MRKSLPDFCGRVASFARREELGGLEFAHGIPGSLGGAVCMNAGAYGGEMKQVLTAVTAWFPDEGVPRHAVQGAGIDDQGVQAAVGHQEVGAVADDQERPELPPQRVQR